MAQGLSTAVNGLQAGAGKLDWTAMSKSNMKPKVDFFFRNAKTWREEFERLRRITLDCGLIEELRWGKGLDD